MKIIIPLIASLLFSLLFYGQSIGLNLTLFSFLTLIVLSVVKTKDIMFRKNISLAIAYFLSAFLVFINHSMLSILVNCFLFILLVGSISEKNTSLYISFFNGFYSVIAGYFHRVIDNKSTSPNEKWFHKIDKWHLLKLLGISIITLTIFILFYKQGNPLFSKLIEQIDFSFIDFQWILFTVLGFYLIYNILEPVKIDPLTNYDLKTINNLIEKTDISFSNLKKETQLGTLLLSLLNLLLIFYIITDVIYQFSIEDFRASTLSSQVHNGINTLIGSILMAILIILYFFRGSLNFYTRNKTLKNLAYLWIGLNSILIILISIKNNQYIDIFGLTYKRIGVYIYLILTLAGLTTTFLKVSKHKNLWFLLRVNTNVAFAILVVSSFINWDYNITSHNLKHAKKIDIQYLINLSDNNAIILKEYSDNNQLNDNLSQQINKKYHDYKTELYSRNWQESSYENLTLTENLRQ